MTLTISDDNLRELGWPRIQRALADRTATGPAREAALAMRFLPDKAAIDESLATVAELMQLIEVGGDLPLSGATDISNALVRAERGATLSAEELLEIARTTSAIAETRRHLMRHRDTFEALGRQGADLPDLALLAHELAQTFDEAGEVRDDASPELAAARQRLIALHRNMKERLESFLQRRELEGVLQDEFYTLREERYVVPVISSLQREVPGIIHGSSNSGETVFIEPHELVEANNAIKVADHALRMEIDRVLRVRSEWVRGEAEELTRAYHAIVALDLQQSKARLAIDLEATVPGVTESGSLSLLQARNPHLLLKGSHVIANDITLDPDHAFLVVTGPNTGGKTVTLSTVGTMVMMVSAGCCIPAAEGSVVPLFSSLWALIGDAQDIERDLSTFSGHLLAIQTILDAAAPGALVLLDEIIVGTEPTQGAALAIAVLESLANRGARGIVTTHYERLKTLAFEDPRFTNASVGLDPTTLAPNFVLSIGRPGSSNPFDIALRLEFPPHIVQRAREVAGGHSHLSAAFDRLHQAEREAELREAEARSSRDAARAERVKLEAERRRLKKQAQAEVSALALEAKKQIRKLLTEIREHRDGLKERTAELASARANLDEERRVAHEIERNLQKAIVEHAPEVLSKEEARSASGPNEGAQLEPSAARVGLDVWVRALGKPGVITELRNDRATISVGAIKTSAHIADLALVKGLPARADTSAAPRAPARVVIEATRRERLSELPDDDERTPPPRTDDITADLRGARRDEVHERVEPLLDRAWRDGIEAVWIIHGHGTGALRAEVRELLARSPQVQGYRRGRRHEGGDGVTIAFLERS